MYTFLLKSFFRFTILFMYISTRKENKNMFKLYKIGYYDENDKKQFTYTIADCRQTAREDFNYTMQEKGYIARVIIPVKDINDNVITVSNETAEKYSDIIGGYYPLYELFYICMELNIKSILGIYDIYKA